MRPSATPLARLCAPALIAALAAAAGAGPRPAAAQEPLPEDSATPAEDTSRELKRILHLANGDTLRAKARQRDGHWEVRAQRAWQALPDGLVVSVAREKDVMAEARRRKKGLDGEDLDARVDLARWMTDAGLKQEALAELDVVLERSPRHAGALELLSHHHYVRVPSLDVPEDQLDEALVALYDWALHQPRATQELAISEFARVRDRQGFCDDVARALGSSSDARRAFATRLLGRLFAGQHVSELLVHSVLDASPEVRKGAAEAVAATGDDATIAPIVHVMQTSDQPVVRRNAAETLGMMGFPSAVPALVSHLAALSAAPSGGDGVVHGYIFTGRQKAYVQDFDVEVAQFQSIADPQVNVLTEGRVQQSAVVAATRVSRAVERAQVRTSLERLTGAQPGRSSKAWLEWWEQNKERWQDGGGER